MINDIVTSKNDIPYSSFVVMTNDKFMSGWGYAQNKINTLIFLCDTEEQALVVAKNACNRSDQSHVRILSGHKLQRRKLRFCDHVYQIKDKNSYPHWYEPNYFKRQK